MAGKPRQGDVGALAESLKRFGQVRPILVQKSTMRIVAWKSTLQGGSGARLGRDAAVVTDMTDKQAKGFVAADNQGQVNWAGSMTRCWQRCSPTRQE